MVDGRPFFKEISTRGVWRDSLGVVRGEAERRGLAVYLGSWKSKSGTYMCIRYSFVGDPLKPTPNLNMDRLKKEKKQLFYVCICSYYGSLLHKWFTKALVILLNQGFSKKDTYPAKFRDNSVDRSLRLSQRFNLSIDSRANICIYLKKREKRIKKIIRVCFSKKRLKIRSWDGFSIFSPNFCCTAYDALTRISSASWRNNVARSPHYIRKGPCLGTYPHAAPVPGKYSVG